MRRGLAGAALLVMLLTACGQQSDIGTAPVQNAFEARAEKVAQAWRAAGISEAFVSMQELAIAPEDGFPTSELKMAFLAGHYTTKASLPTLHGSGVIRFPDGRSLDVPLLSAATAFQHIDKGEPGTGGVALEITAATLATAKVRTSRGTADVPAWQFTVKDLSQPVIYVAVAQEAIKPMPTLNLDPADARGNLVSAQDLTAVSGNTIDYRLGVGACDEAIEGLVWESDDIVVVGGTVRQPPPDQACTLQLLLHPVKVTVAKEVGNRVILDAATGSPVLLSTQ